MDNQELLKALRNQITDLDALLRELSKSSEIASIDADLFLQKIRDLYAQAKSLGQALPSKVPVPEQAKAPVPVKERVQEFIPTPTPAAPVKETAPITPDPDPAPAPAFASRPAPEPKTAETPQRTITQAAAREAQPAPVPPAVGPSQTPRLGEKLRPQNEAVNEIYGKAKSAGKSTSNLQPVSDIFIAIGLNDRFLFTRELFNNDSVLFKSTITTLNNLQNFEAAVEFVKKEFKWNEEDPVTEQFMHLVKRRYI